MATENKINCQAILAIDDDADFLVVLKSMVKKILPDVKITEYNPTEKGRPDDAFNWSEYDLILLDYDLGNGEKGLDWLRHYKNSEDFPTTIMLTGHGNEELAVQAMRFGAEDYINKLKLSVDRLSEAFSSALIKKKKQQNISNTLSIQSKLFNKVDFYKKLRDKLKTIEKSQDKYSFIMQIGIDEYNKLHQKYGLLLTDNFSADMVQKIAKEMTAQDCDINYTRIGDAHIGCLITNHTDKNGGELIAKLICDFIKNYSFSYKQKTLASTISIGFLAITEANLVAEKLLNMVDFACLQAGKQSGNSYYKLENKKSAPEAKPSDKPVQKKTTKTEAKTDSEKKSVENKKWPKLDLNEVIKQNRIQPNYQPFMALSGNTEVFDAEFFQLNINIIDIQGNIISQGDFESIQLDSDSQTLLDRWMLRQGLGQLFHKKMKDKDQECGLFMRLSDESFTNKDLCSWMLKLIADTKTFSIASKVVLEISPTEYLRNKKIVQDFINRMRETIGVSFALYDVINPAVVERCIQQAGFEFIKIPMNSASVEIIPQITEKAREFGSLTVLNNIENGEQLNNAILAEADYGQGDFIHPPIEQLVTSIDEIEI